MGNVKKQYIKLKKSLNGGVDINLSDEEVLYYQDVLVLLEKQGYIFDMKIDGANYYRKTAEWDGFEEWLNYQINGAKKTRRREWMMGIVCAVIGAIISLLPYIISLLTNIK